MSLEVELQELLLSEYGPHFRTVEIAKRLAAIVAREVEAVKPRAKPEKKGVSPFG